MYFSIENKKRLVWELSFAANSEESEESIIEEERRERTGE
jgi:hypothetical protein